MFIVEVSLSVSWGFLTCRKILRHGPTALLPVRRKACSEIYRHLKSISLAGFEPANHASNGKHDNYYTTEATRWEHGIEQIQYGIRVWTELIWVRIGTGGGLLWACNDPPCSIKCGQIIDELGDCQLMKRTLFHAVG
jgi:hypothetical protein